MKRKIILMIIIMNLLLSSCSSKPKVKPINNKTEQKNTISAQAVVSKDTKNIDNSANVNSKLLVENIKNKYKDSAPMKWGEKEKGLISTIDTKEKIIALTFDACGGGKGNGYDSRLISYLIKENVSATLFINARWIDVNLDTFKMLSKNPLFEIENHGYSHKPLSVNGKSAYDIKGTSNIDEAINEVYFNEQKIQKLTGRKPRYFRSGTAYYDDVAINIIKEIGEKPVNFSIVGDAGATFNTEQIVQASSKAKNGSIILYHMNHPEKSTSEGIMKIVPLLKEKGFKFVKLEDYDTNLK